MACPIDLEELLYGIPKPTFDFMTHEPSLEEERENLREETGEVSEKEIIQRFRARMKAYQIDQKILERLHEYGRTREEIVAGIATHIRTCKKCFEQYYGYLKNIAGEDLGEDWKLGENGIEATMSRDYARKIRELDKMHLGILKW